jgi:hypothetical protein
MNKKCFKCGEDKPLHDFYKHPRMGDGHLNKCKECTKSDVKERYAAEPDKIAAYERQRSQSAHRKSLVLVYQRHRRARAPEKDKARQALANALRSGRVVRLPCEVCGECDVEAHHDDYSRPLDVRWLCFKHHRENAHGQRVIEQPPS